MQPARVKVLLVQFCYGGNGGVPMVIPALVSWTTRVHSEMKADPRIEQVAIQILADTPITMTRNRAVKIAKEGGYDFILMLDSDNQPDAELKSDPSAKPFWKTSFDFAYDRMMKGLPTVVCAPYCGHPPYENVFCFYWESHENSPHSSFSLDAYPRHVAATMTGIQPIAAGPTGVTLYSTDAFDLMDPPYFYYEFKDEPYQTEKASTEDVTNFRDINLQGVAKFGGPVVFANWDAWAAHAKVKYVRKPQIAYADDVSERFKTAMMRNIDRNDKLVEIDFESNMKKLQEQEQAILDASSEIRMRSDMSTDEEGVAIKKRTIFGRVVKSVGHQTPEHALNTLASIVEMASQNAKVRELRCVEVGSWVGESAVAIVSGFKHGGTLYCVDSFQGDGGIDPINRAIESLGSDAIKSIFLENTKDLPVKLIVGESKEVAAKIDRSEADVVFIDAGHEYEDARADIYSWLPHVAADGILCGDDYCDSFPGVMKAVDEIFIDRGIEVRQPEGTNLWVVLKKDVLACQTK